MDETRSRNRYRMAVTALTGVATVGSLTAAGVTSGAMARAARQDTVGGAIEVVPAADRSAQRPVRVVRWEQRPRRTVVRVHRVVRVTAALPTGAGLPAGAALPTGTAVPPSGTGLGGGTVTALPHPLRPTAAAPAGPAAPAPAGPGGSGTSNGPDDASPAPAPTPSDPPPPTPSVPQPSVPSTGS